MLVRISILFLAILLFTAPPLPVTFAAEVPRWQTTSGGRFAELSVPPNGRTGFTTMPAGATGILFTNVLTVERGLTNQIFMSGSGVALGDMDNDGRVDIYFCGLDCTNRLYRNLGGWKFADVTPAALACPEGGSTGAVFADTDADRDLDLLVTGIGRGVRLFQNNGTGQFTEITDQAGLRSAEGSMSMALADCDGDGDVDLYVANYRSSTFQDEPAVRFRVATTNGPRRITMIDGRPPTAADLVRYSVSSTGNMILENGEADALYRNDGQGRFSRVSWTDGTFLDAEGRALTAPPYDWGYTAMFRDINGDGSPDLYVCNDNESPDRCWLNEGSGRFRAMSNAALRQTSLSSMGVDFADLNRDGLDEFIVADMLSRDHEVRHRQMIDRRPLHPIGIFDDRPAYQRNTLFLNRGDNTYAEIAQMAGIEATDWTWLPVFLDVDLDGFEDLLVTTGLERSLRDADARRFLEKEKAQRRLTTREFQELRRIMPKLDVLNHAYRNRGDLTFEDTSAAWGFNSTLNSQGLALADLDGDGDQDIAINVLNGPALILRNESAAPRLAVRLLGRSPNLQAIGAKIRVTGGPVSQSQEIVSGGRYLSGDEGTRTFAAGQRTNRLRMEITWRNGNRSILSNAIPNRIYEVDEAGAHPTPRSLPAKEPVWFSDVSARLNHRHDETPFNDFQRQLLLPRRFSQAGPGVCWTDLNEDGAEDLVIGAGRGGTPGVFLNNKQGGFTRLDVREVLGVLDDDSAFILAHRETNGVALLIAVSNYERGSTNESSVLQFRISPEGVHAKPALNGLHSIGPGCLGDVDADGLLDLFQGGRVIAGRYPEAATSRLYRGGRNGFEPDQRNRLFEQLGLVSGAAFSDLNADGFPELLLACEWGPIRIYRNRRGQYEPWDPKVRFRGKTKAEVNLGQLTGWWNSITTGDFDGDGRLDIVAGNWGRNSKYQHYLERPLMIYYGDLRGDGGCEAIEAHYEPRFGNYVPWRYWDTLAMVMPSLQERLPNAAAYSQAGVGEVLGDLRPRLKHWEAVTFDSMLFLNRDEFFEAAPLPLEAQLSPAFGLCVGDFDGDGNEDLFVAQNFFGVDPETSRHDAGRGLLLRGNGRGNFDSVPAIVSGLDIAGEQRGAAVADFDTDGRLDLLVTQNGASTRLFRNGGAAPGLRVRLDAGPGNRHGLGAALRVRTAGKSGPAREIRAGAGYWSQDSPVQILSSPAGRKTLVVRWPGGRTSTYDVPEAAQEVLVDVTLGLKKIR
ncbi:MAG TPA: VCBS repeat-containing protein [Verrucomicrobiae bacterium]|nr:VCBS repeat-containing protein [Verrucomicrobiae bacterium]